jgi:hypothetical protein
MSATDVLDTVAAGAYLGGSKPIPRQTMAFWRSKKAGPPYFHAGAQVRYRRADLDNWIAARLRNAAPEAAK